MKQFVWFVIMSLGVLPGCGRGPGPDADPDQADRALQTALEAWKAGKSPLDLEQDSPPVIMNDDDWRTGKRLLEFRAEKGALSGRQVRCRVHVKLQDKGKTVEKDAVYIIDTTPRIVIVRDSFAT